MISAAEPGPAPAPLPRREAAVLGLAALVLLAVDAGARLPAQTAEARVPVAARTMAREGLSPVARLGGLPWSTKPPLAVWLQALSMRAFGETLAAASLPGAVLAAAAAFAVARRGGLVAGLALLLSPRFLLSARGAELDIVFASLTALAILRGLDEIDAGGRVGLASQLILGLALLTKGPLALVFALLAWGRGWLSAWAPLALVPPAAWAAWADRVHPGIGLTWYAQLAGAVGRSHTAHNAPAYAYVVALPVLAAPAVLPLAIAAVERLRGSRAGPVAPGRAVDRRLFRWLAGGLLILSLLPLKQSSYALPIYPALALLGVQAAGFARRSRLLRAYLGVLLAAVPVAAILVLPLAARWQAERSLVPIGERVRALGDASGGTVAALGSAWEEVSWGAGADIPCVASAEEARARGFRWLLVETTESASAPVAPPDRAAPADATGTAGLPAVLEARHPRHRRRLVRVLDLEGPRP